MFAPTVHVERLELKDQEERLQLWATANGEAKTWVSRRTLDRPGLRVGFRQEVPQSPVAAMGGEWVIEAVSESVCSVLLTHDYTAVDDVPDAEQWIAQAVDRNSTVELAALKASLEQGPDTRRDLDFEDTVEIDGPLSAVHAFLHRAQEWPDRLPHVSRVELRELTGGLQHLEMDTLTKDGSTHTTASVRVCLPDNRIVYKQLVLPPLLSLHLGCWLLTETPEGGVLAASRHTVRLRPEAVVPSLGEGKTVEDAEAFVRGALGANSTATLLRAKAFAEGRDHG